MRNLLHEYSDVFSEKPNLTNVATHKIDTGGSSPIRSVPYRIPQILEEEVNKEIEKMLQNGYNSFFHKSLGGPCCFELLSSSKIAGYFV